METEQPDERVQRLSREVSLRRAQWLVARAELEEPEPTAPLRLITRKVSQVDCRPVEWLWPNWLPRGMVTLFAGYGGGGKTTIALSIAAAISANNLFPDRVHRAPVGRVLILAAEDSPEHTLKPRLMQMGANTHRITIAEGVGTDDIEPGWINLRHHVAQLEDEIEREGFDLLIIDPISSYIGEMNTDREPDVRAGLLPLIQLAERTGVAILLIRHLTKGGDNPRAAAKILGSTAWHDIPRVVWMLADAPEDYQPEPGPDGLRDMMRVVGVVKSNIAAKPAARWYLQPANAPLQWQREPSPVSVDQCFSGQQAAVATKVQEAEAWLAEFLKGGMQRTLDVERAAEESGFSKRTLKRARQTLGIRALKIGSPAEWFLQLPTREARNQEGQQEDRTSGVAPLAPLPYLDNPSSSSIVYVHHESEYEDDEFLP